MQFTITLKSESSQIKRFEFVARHELHAHELAQCEADTLGSFWYVYTIQDSEEVAYSNARCSR